MGLASDWKHVFTLSAKWTLLAKKPRGPDIFRLFQCQTRGGAAPLLPQNQRQWLWHHLFKKVIVFAKKMKFKLFSARLPSQQMEDVWFYLSDLTEGFVYYAHSRDLAGTQDHFTFHVKDDLHISPTYTATIYIEVCMAINNSAAKWLITRLNRLQISYSEAGLQRENFPGSTKVDTGPPNLIGPPKPYRSPYR